MMQNIPATGSVNFLYHKDVRQFPQYSVQEASELHAEVVLQASFIHVTYLPQHLKQKQHHHCMLCQ
jgi:PP-loop superfamily ATP-utilizing enzyme